MSEILPGKLYLGPIECAMNADWLRKRGVRTVITVMKEHEDLADLFDAVRAATRDAEVARHEVVPVDDWNYDGERLADALPACGRIIADTIDGDVAAGDTKSGGAVLVHCMMGVSRSATVVLAYLVAQRRMPLDEALRQVLKERSWIFPNEAFTRELLALERRELGFSRYFPSDPNAGLAAFRRFSYQVVNESSAASSKEDNDEVRTIDLQEEAAAAVGGEASSS